MCPQDSTVTDTIYSVAKNHPTKEDYRVPLNKAQHEGVVDKLILAGSSPIKAQSIINQKNAFNKALREFKKGSAKYTKVLPKNTKKPIKHASKDSAQNGF